MYKKLIMFLFIALVFTGCDGGSASQTAVDTSGSKSVVNSESAVLYDNYSDDYDNNSTAEDTNDVDNTNNTSEKSDNDLDSRKLIKTVNISYDTEQFDDLRDSINSLISKHSAYIENSDLNSPINYSYSSEGYYKESYTVNERYLSLKIRVPSSKLDSFLDSLYSYDTNLAVITDKSETVEDVTLSYVDIQAKKEALDLEYERVQELLDKATTLDEILTIENKLSDLRYRIDSLVSQLNTYNNLIDYSTVNITISEVKYATPVAKTVWERISSGFMQNLNLVKDTIVTMFVNLIASLPIIVFAGCILLLILFILIKIDKAHKRKRLNNENKLLNIKKD